MSASAVTQVVTAPFSEWRDIDTDPPPRGAKIWLLTMWGVAVSGVYYEEGQFIAWSPLPQVSPELKEKMRVKREAYFTG